MRPLFLDRHIKAFKQQVRQERNTQEKIKKGVISERAEINAYNAEHFNRSFIAKRKTETSHPARPFPDVSSIKDSNLIAGLSARQPKPAPPSRALKQKAKAVKPGTYDVTFSYRSLTYPYAFIPGKTKHTSLRSSQFNAPSLKRFEQQQKHVMRMQSTSSPKNQAYSTTTNSSNTDFTIFHQNPTPPQYRHQQQPSQPWPPTARSIAHTTRRHTAKPGWVNFINNVHSHSQSQRPHTSRTGSYARGNESNTFGSSSGQKYVRFTKPSSIETRAPSSRPSTSQTSRAPAKKVVTFDLNQNQRFGHHHHHHHHHKSHSNTTDKWVYHNSSHVAVKYTQPVRPNTANSLKYYN